MTNQVKAHCAILRLDQPIPENVPVGSEIKLKAIAMCPSGCDLSGGLVYLLADQQILATGNLVRSQDNPVSSETEQFSLKVPERVGSNSWVLLFGGHKVSSMLHEQASLTISLDTTPIETSLAVWDIRSPVIIGESFRVKVGVKSSRACALKGATVELLDSTGERKGIGRLGDCPWEGTTALYWTEIEAAAPQKEGPACWSVRFAAANSNLPHDHALADFTFVASRPPDRKLIIRIFDRETRTPIDEAQVRLGCFRTVTNASGLAEVEIPDGCYEVKAWMVAHELCPTTIEVTEDMKLELEAVPVPEEEPGALWTM
jgi:hypothetical protein